MEIITHRIYDDDDPAHSGYRRILIDRLWPRGISKTRASLDYWARDIAPSNELRKWYGHDHTKWDAFKTRYFAELDASPAQVNMLLEQMGEGPVVFLYSSRERELNNATALKEYVGLVLGRD